MKIDRLVAIIMMLNNKNKVTAKELSEKFEVSTKTIQRDMEIIEKAGIPLVTHKGYNGGYSILEGYKVNKASMTKEEAVLVNKLLLELNKSYENPETSSLINKLGVVDTKLSDLSDRLIIDFSRWGNKTEINKAINAIDKAILNRNPIEFKYVNIAGEGSYRIVEPYKLIFKALDWYIYGYCNLKREMRIFKVNRIKDLRTLDEKFILKADSEFELFKEKELPKIDIIIKFKTEFKNVILETFEINCDKEEGDFTTAIVSMPYSNWIEGIFLSFGENIEVLSPLFLRNNLKAKVEAIRNLYK